MRAFALLSALLIFTGCSGSGPYSRQDLRQVRQAYRVLGPTYSDFKDAYLHNDATRIVRDYRRERRICRIVDAVDKRDTIDPNTKLFQASIGNDDFCNAIESAYTGWARAHHYPYDKSILPGEPPDVFHDADLSLPKMRGYLRDPSSYS